MSCVKRAKQALLCCLRNTLVGRTNTFARRQSLPPLAVLLIGNGCITPDEERTQMAIWSIVAGPLIMGNDMVSNRKRIAGEEV